MRLIDDKDYRDIYLAPVELDYELYIKGNFEAIIKAPNENVADTKVHQLYPYLTDDDYELELKYNKRVLVNR